MKGRKIGPSAGSCMCVNCIGRGGMRLFRKRYLRRWARRWEKQMLVKGRYENL